MTFEKFLETFLGPFFGAFAAYAFMQLSQISIKRSERFTAYLNAMLSAERFLANTINALKNDELLIEHYIRILKERKLFQPLLFTVELDRRIFQFILNPELYNDVNYTFDYIRLYNTNIKDFDHKYAETKKLAYNTDKRSLNTYVKNIDNSLIPTLESIKTYQKNLEEHILLTLAKLKVFQDTYRKGKCKYRFHIYLYSNTYEKPKDYEILVSQKLTNIKIEGERLLRKTKADVA
ncbi:hypothetical protein [Leptospira stimsonii]|uniref:DUF4760 domain-containing protein n=1 Tax=Leptospira stimsonii TaxID=2202203 RepID=A0ABY2NEM6_9LEPT|nr:hypothetical protein [Leptospira stimsonii]TGK26063.1 hypothetical protein EHO98_01570 [Leptospira stimsonii]TGM22496.1 hypothetical protein EHQ90_00900 [Leptospira stimsonii]